MIAAPRGRAHVEAKCQRQYRRRGHDGARPHRAYDQNQTKRIEKLGHGGACPRRAMITIREGKTIIIALCREAAWWRGIL